MDDVDKIVLICWPVAWGNGGQIMGSIMTVCMECGCDIFMAPSGQQLVAEEKDAQVLCIPCGQRLTQEQADAGEEVKIHVRRR